MEGPAEKKSRTNEAENIAAVLYGVDDLRMVIFMMLLPLGTHVILQVQWEKPTAKPGGKASRCT